MDSGTFAKKFEKPWSTHNDEKYVHTRQSTLGNSLVPQTVVVEPAPKIQAPAPQAWFQRLKWVIKAE